ncbi:ATP-binding protein [Streptomyces sp. NPDC059679]|uniref:ATP-binding protein n=1 Tax=Streptomyces sp. NPDC059679 TaxID=3346903 RepID=UPI003691389F
MISYTSRKHTFRILPSEAAASHARRAVLASACFWGLPSGSDLAGTVQLLASELITNAVCHAGSTSRWIVITVQIDEDGRFGLGVQDDDPGDPQDRHEPVNSTSGRGLAIVNALVAECRGRTTVERHHDGSKTVWAYIPDIHVGDGSPAVTVAASAA